MANQRLLMFFFGTLFIHRQTCRRDSSAPLFCCANFHKKKPNQTNAAAVVVSVFVAEQPQNDVLAHKKNQLFSAWVCLSRLSAVQ